jgi:ketosteroid isomerase-like protein
MSQEDVERIRQAYESYARRGDISLVLSLIAPECEIHDVPTIPDPEVHRGPEGFVRSQAKFAEVFEDLRVEAEQVVDAGDQVLVLARARGRERSVGVQLTAAVAAVWTMRAGKAIRADFYDSWRLAREAAGLVE